MRRTLPPQTPSLQNPDEIRSRASRGLTASRISTPRHPNSKRWYPVRLRSPLLQLVLVASAALGAVLPPASPAASTWRDVTGDTGTSNTQVQAARSTGVTRLAWVAPSTTTDGSVALYERDIAASGKLGPVRTLLDGQDGLTNPAIAVNPLDGRVWVYGAGSATMGGGLFAVSSGDGFASWTPAASISGYGYAYAAFGLGAVFTKSGAPYETFARWLKTGNALASAEDDFGTAPGLSAGIDLGCCTYWSQPAVDGVTGAASVGWYSNVTDRSGIEVLDVATNTLRYVPGSADAGRDGSTNGDMQTPITGRIGASGTFVGYCSGYPTCKQARVWRVGSSKPTVVGTGSSLQYARIAAAPDGRLWAFWVSKRSIVARRSNASATAWGAPVTVAVPGSADDAIWRTGGAAAPGWLDVLVSGEFGAGDATRTTRIRAGLSLLGPARAKPGASVTFTVKDAGVPVKGATVRIGKATATTNAAGTATLMVPSTLGTKTVTASRTGYTKATRTVVVKAG